MKRRYGMIVCLWAVWLAMSAPVAAQPVRIIENGKPLAAIYIAEALLDQAVLDEALSKSDSAINRGLVEIGQGSGKYRLASEDIYRSVAVAELIYHFQQMSGAKLPVIVAHDIAAVKPPGIVLGALANRLGAAPRDISPSREGFRIKTGNGLVLIGGESGLAVRHGVYELLQRSGVDWVMPGKIGEIIPSRPRVDIAEIDIEQQPDFQFRRLWYRGYRDGRPEERLRFRRWRWRHKGANVHNPIMNVRAHYWQSFIKKHQAEFDADPTMLALVKQRDGSFKRRGPQINSTHPRVIELFIDDIRKTYAENIAAGKWTADTAAGFPIGPADGLGFSLAPDELGAGGLQIDPIIGEWDRTDELVLLANRVLEAVTKDYPNAYVGFYSYGVHGGFPSRYKPHPNLVQEFAPIMFSRYHSLLDGTSKTQRFYRQVVEKWADLSRQQGNILAYLGYNWNLADNLMPYSKISIWGEEMAYYHRHGFIGFSIEATKQWSVLAPSDYVLMRLAWDSSLDWRELLKQFCAHAYGKGAKAMMRYWLRLIKTQRAAGMEAGSYHAIPLIFDNDWVAAARADIAAALAMADNEADKVRIRHVSIGVDFLHLYLNYHHAVMDFDFTRAHQHYRGLLARWQAAYNRNSDLVANEGPRYLKGFIGPFVKTADYLSSAPYRIVARLPDELKTVFDPENAGERMNLHSPDIRDDGFITTRTFSSTWDAQGLGAMRSASVWYRWRFKLGDDLRHEPVGLFLGSVEDEARIWLNGKYLGTSGQRFSRPIVADLTGQLAENGDNLLVIQVIRNSKFNELGLGGILRPGFLFTGPKINKTTDDPEAGRRILPGGETEPQ